MEKDFDSWNILKKKLDENKKSPFFKARDVWWCSIGLNVGDEENGKSQFFSRPVLVIRKFNSRLFLGLPLTTQVKENKYYHKITFKNAQQCAMMSQLRILESRRMRSRMGDLPKGQFEEILKRNGLEEVVIKKDLK